MPPADPLTGVAIIAARGLQQEPVFLGTTFAYRSQHWWLTASHCVGEVPPAQLAVVSAIPHVYWRTIEAVEHHPEADLAVLRARPMDDDSGPDPAEPFWGCVGNYALGEDFYAFGFPESVFGEDSRVPTARLFKGSYQRFFPHRSFTGRTYLAGEMSVAAPAGLSGGPLFRPGAQQMVTGLVTENLESTTTLEAIEEVTHGDVTRTTRYQRVISYGVALMLDPLTDWLDERIAPRA